MKYKIDIGGVELSGDISPETRARLLSALSPPTPPDPAPIPVDGIEVRTSAELKARLDAIKAGQVLILRQGIYTLPCNIRADNVTIKAYEGENVVINAFVKLNGNWQKQGHLWRIDYNGFAGLRRHPATNEGSWDGHRDRMRPEQVQQAGKILRPVYKKEHIEPGTFWVEGPVEKPTAIYLITHDEKEPAGMAVSAIPKLLYSSIGAKGVTVEGITFQGAACTGKEGMVETRDGWRVANNKFMHAASTGLLMRGKDLSIINNYAVSNGQLGYIMLGAENARFIGNRATHNNTKGFNQAQEAGGGKFLWSSGVQIIDYVTELNNGVGCWVDVGNKGVEIENYTSTEDQAAALMLEHGLTGDSWVKGAIIKNVREFIHPVHGHSRRDGVVLQSRIFGALLENIHIDGAHKGIVYKKHERRGGSYGNRFKDITYANIDNQNFYLEKMRDAAILDAVRRFDAIPEHPADWHRLDFYENAGFTP